MVLGVDFSGPAAVCARAMSAHNWNLGQNKSLRNQVLEVAESFKGMSFKEQFENIHQSIKNIYLPQYEELSTLVDEEDSEACFIANFMGEHERSILLAAENIIKDKPNPVQPIKDLLRFPI